MNQGFGHPLSRIQQGSGGNGVWHAIGSFEASGKNLRNFRKAVIESLEMRTLLSGTYTVNSLTDGSGGGTVVTLRSAIAEANANGGGIINFDPSLFPPGSPQTIDLTGSPLTIDAPGSLVTIDGPGSGDLTISGQNSVGDFIVNSDAEISGLTISDGTSNFGGGIDNTATLTLDHDTITDNTVIGAIGFPSGRSAADSDFGIILSIGSGGGIYNTGTLTVENSLVSSNTAPGNGAGIFSDGTLTVTTDSTITGNTAMGIGGGIFNDGPL